MKKEENPVHEAVLKLFIRTQMKINVEINIQKECIFLLKDEDLKEKLWRIMDSVEISKLNKLERLFQLLNS